jgi:hypothetical protein
MTQRRRKLPAPEEVVLQFAVWHVAVSGEGWDRHRDG